jgi:hypothetical protein
MTDPDTSRADGTISEYLLVARRGRDFRHPHGVEGLPRAVAGGSKAVVLTPGALKMLTTLPGASMSSRLAGELVVRGRRRLWLTGSAG